LKKILCCDILEKGIVVVIAIDGPAGSGKSTIAALIARRHGFLYINSGSLYRALTWGCFQNSINPLDAGAALNYAKNARLEYRAGALQGDASVFLDNVDVTDKLRTDAVDKQCAGLSANVPLRHVVNGIIKKTAEGRDIVVEGRDMTTVVFPDAEQRFYLDAAVETRAKRRLAQGVSSLGLDEIIDSINERDATDKHKEEGSLKIAAGVKYIDGSHLTIEEVYGIIYSSMYKQKRNNNGSD
jgi:cytidylate kinase